MSISPFIRLPMTDITGGMVSHQMLGRCQMEEMKVMDCLEAYGLDRGLRKCVHFIEDFHECATLQKQIGRFSAMQQERQRQIRAGKLTGDKQYVNPRVDSY